MKNRSKEEVLQDIRVVEAKLATIQRDELDNPIDSLYASILEAKEEKLYRELKAFKTIKLIA